MQIKVDDIVEVMTGSDRGTRAKVLRVLHSVDKVVVEGVNRVYRHVRRSQRNSQGGRLSKEMPISWSNVRLVCPLCSKASRTGSRFRDDGSKERYCKSCDKAISAIAPRAQAHAKK